MQEIIIHNWDELQRAVFDDVWDEKIMRYRDNRIYRGMADESWNLVPSLNRVCGHDLSLETQVFRSFRKYGYAELAEYSGFWKLLPVAQHHGLPTRLLDWTYSPLVAAHFATEDTSCYDCDGVIWCLDVTDFRKYMPAPLLRKLKAFRPIVRRTQEYPHPPEYSQLLCRKAYLFRKRNPPPRVYIRLF